MEYVPQALASIAAIVGPAATIIGLIHSRGWLAVVGAVFAAAAIAFYVYARRQNQRLNSAVIEIEGISIDATNAANLRRRVNRTLMIQSAEQSVTIDGPDLDMVWRYAGYCRADHETSLEFSVDSTHAIPFSDLDCYAHDLRRDPDKKHKIEPLLLGPDGISKKIAVPFLEPLRSNEPFDVSLHCRMPDTYRAGIGYYTSSLSLDQKRVGRLAVHLRFTRSRPKWVRVYSCEPAAGPRLLKSLYPVREDDDEIEYRDLAENLSAQSTRIYLFKRDEF